MRNTLKMLGAAALTGLLVVLLTPCAGGQSLIGWGTNDCGEAAMPPDTRGSTAIAAGFDHSLALKSDGTVVGWGYDYDGQATPPSGLTGVVAISAGVYHSLALKQDGTVVGWGYSNYGQATPPSGLTGVVAIAAGGYYSLALKQDGTVIGWGSNNYGQATPPSGLTGVVAISAGFYHSLALRQDGTTVGWGYNAYGQATPPSGLSGVVAIAAGGGHSLALVGGTPAPPLVANAGPDQTVAIPHDGDPANGTASVTLDGSVSSGEHGGPLTYAWTEGAAALASGAKPTVDLAAGVHPITLTVVDPDGGSASDDVVVTVLPEPNQAPTAEAGDNRTVEATGPQTDVALDGTASSDPDRAPGGAMDVLTYSWMEGGVEFAATAQPTARLGVGEHTVALTVTDPYGAISSDSVVITVVDTAPPSISGVPPDMTVIAASAAGSAVEYTMPTASDLVDGAVPVSASPASGSVFPLGTTKVPFTAQDSSGNSASTSINVTVVYGWSGFLPPTNTDGSSVFKLGSTVPVKFQLTGASAGIADATARLLYAKVSDGVAGDVNEASSTSAATIGNLFRYDPTSGIYVFNWSTKGLTVGTYELQIDLGDGVMRSVRVGLR